MKCRTLFGAAFLACLGLSAASFAQLPTEPYTSPYNGEQPRNTLRPLPPTIALTRSGDSPSNTDTVTVPSRNATPGQLPGYADGDNAELGGQPSAPGFGSVLFDQLRSVSNRNRQTRQFTSAPPRQTLEQSPDTPHRVELPAQVHDGVGSGLAVDNNFGGSAITFDAAPTIGCAPIGPRGPLWLGRVDFYMLKRTDTNPLTVLVDETTRTIPEFDAQHLEFDYEFGVGATLARCLGCGSSLQLGYFGVYDHDAFTELNGDLALVVPGFAIGNNPADFAMNYESELHSGEININQQLCNRFTLLAGFRYIHLRDDLQISSQIGPAVVLDTYGIDAVNNLYGFQLGSQVMVGRWGRFQLDALVKCGVYLNDTEQTTHSSLTAIPAVTAHADTFATGGEAGLFGTYCITDCWSVRAGYQVLGLNGVTLAPEQLQESNLTTGLAGIDPNGSIFYHGATVGIQLVR